MNEVLAYSFEPVNLFPTILLIITVLYWVAVMLGALDMGFLDFDLDADFETDVELEVDLSSEAGGDGSFGLFHSFLSFFNLGRVPFMVFVSAFSLGFWLISINVNYYLNISGVLAVISLVIAFGIALFLTKILTFPLIPIFKSLNKEATRNEDLTGALGVMKLKLKVGQLGQAKVRKNDETFNIYVKSSTNEAIEKNQQVIVIDFINNEGCFLVEPFNFNN